MGGIDLQKGGRKYRKNISAIECYKDTRKKRIDQKCWVSSKFRWIEIGTQTNSICFGLGGHVY